MTEISTVKLIGTALIVSEDAVATRQLAEAMQELALSVEVCIKVSDFLDRVNRSKLEVVVIDFLLGNQATLVLQQVRGSASNRTAITFAITSSSTETAYALKAGSSFALERPLTPDSIRHTLKVAYGLIVRERRRYFRYPISVPAVAIKKGEPEVFGRTANISERGVALSTSAPLMPGTEVTIQFTLTKPQLAITADCKVCWHNDKGQSGLLFLFLPSNLRTSNKTSFSIHEGPTHLAGQVLGCSVYEQPFASRCLVESDSTDAAAGTT
jgi:ActR/RegA family two-component response regulator